MGHWRSSIGFLNWEPVGHLQPAPFPCLQNLADKLSVRESGGEGKEKTYCAVGIAQVERELSVVGKRLVSMTFANLGTRLIEIAKKTGIGKFTSSQYKGVRPSIAD